MNEAKSLDRSVRKMVSILVEIGLDYKLNHQSQTSVYQPQPQLQPEPQFYMGMPRDPDMRPQWQIDEIDKLKKEKLVRTNELRKAKDTEIKEYMEQDECTEDGVKAITDTYNQLVEAVKKEIDDKLDAIYENNA